MKNSKDTIGNRTRDLLPGSAVPQQTSVQGKCVKEYERTVGSPGWAITFEKKNASNGFKTCAE